MIRRPLLYACLSLLLLFAQGAEVLHELSHLREHPPAREGKQLPHSSVCDKCIAFAQLGGGPVPVTPLSFSGVHEAIPCPVAALVSAVSAPTRRYVSRAPPPRLV